eukprot:PhM_4_TR5749/c0_g1_i1/m.86967/K17915/KIF14; kinesin family member 14
MNMKPLDFSRLPSRSGGGGGGGAGSGDMALTASSSVSSLRQSPSLLSNSQKRLQGGMSPEGSFARTVSSLGDACVVGTTPRGTAKNGISVFVRVRPFSYDEASSMQPKHTEGEDDEDGESFMSSAISANTPEELVLTTTSNAKDHIFHVDGVMWSVPTWQASMPMCVPHVAQQCDVFDVAGAPMLENTMKGFNGCILVYGPTGSGKTYTMMGTIESPGIISNVCEELFRQMAKASSTSTSGEEAISFHTKAVFYEVYNEHIFDLMNSGGPALRVRQDPKHGPFVDGLKEIEVQSSADCWALVSQGLMQRSTSETLCNQRSSRSHAIFQLIISRTDKISLPSASVRGGESCRSAPAVHSSRTYRLSLVDLAGSENTRVSGAMGTVLTEANHINLSLSTLRKVIDALLEKSKGRKVLPPYRESTLTWVLSEDLGGNCRTTMIATVSPFAAHAEETLRTLRYAVKARGIVKHTHIVEDTTSRLIRELREEVSRCQRQIVTHHQRGVHDLSFPAIAVNIDGTIAQWNAAASELLTLEEGVYLRHALNQPAFENIEEDMAMGSPTPRGPPGAESVGVNDNPPLMSPERLSNLRWHFSSLPRKDDASERVYLASCLTRLGGAWVCLVRDASDDFVTQTQAAVQQQVIDLSPLGIATLTKDGIVVMMNIECAELFECDKTAMVGQPINDMSADMLRPIFQSNIIGRSRKVLVSLPSGTMRMSVILKDLVTNSVADTAPDAACYMITISRIGPLLARPTQLFQCIETASDAGLDTSTTEFPSDKVMEYRSTNASEHSTLVDDNVVGQLQAKWREQQWRERCHRQPPVPPRWQDEVRVVDGRRKKSGLLDSSVFSCTSPNGGDCTQLLASPNAVRPKDGVPSPNCCSREIEEEENDDPEIEIETQMWVARALEAEVHRLRKELTRTQQHNRALQRELCELRDQSHSPESVTPPNHEEGSAQPQQLEGMTSSTPQPVTSSLAKGLPPQEDQPRGRRFPLQPIPKQRSNQIVDIDDEVSQHCRCIIS